MFCLIMAFLDYRDLVGVSNPCRAFAHPSWMAHFKYVQIKYEVSEWLYAAVLKQHDNDPKNTSKYVTYWLLAQKFQLI